MVASYKDKRTFLIPRATGLFKVVTDIIIKRATS